MDTSLQNIPAQQLELKDLQGANADARVWKWTPAQRHRAARKSAFLKALHEHATIGVACQVSGVPDVTILRWRRAYPAFDQAVSDFLINVREQRVVDSLYQLTQKALEDPKFASAGGRAGEFLLKAWNPEQFAERLKVDTRHELNI